MVSFIGLVFRQLIVRIFPVGIAIKLSTYTAMFARTLITPIKSSLATALGATLSKSTSQLAFCFTAVKIKQSF